MLVTDSQNSFLRTCRKKLQKSELKTVFDYYRPLSELGNHNFLNVYNKFIIIVEDAYWNHTNDAVRIINDIVKKLIINFEHQQTYGFKGSIRKANVIEWTPFCKR